MFDDEGNERASNVSLDPSIKKDVANMVRRIQKNRIWMQRFLMNSTKNNR
jgi:hypothetical protein